MNDLRTILCLAILFCPSILMPAPTFAQRGGGDRGRGGGDRGGGDRGGGDRGGGDRGRGGGDRGGGDRGRGGGDRGSWGGRGSFDPSSFLTRMDKNKNGVLERNEVDSRVEGWLKRSYPEANFSKGVKISTLSKKMSEARSRDRGGEQRGDEEEPAYDVGALVPGFGEVVESASVINFGSTPENYVEISDADRERARSVMKRYDRNKDGALDSKEQSSTSSWSDDLNQYDINRDGRISTEEMATRYAHHRRKEKEQKAASDSRQDRSDRRRREPDPPGVEVVRGAAYDDEAPSKYVAPQDRLPEGAPEWFVEKDKNFDGQISMSEYLDKVTTAQVEEFVAMDTDNDGILLLSELGVSEGEGGSSSSGDSRENDSRPPANALAGRSKGRDAGSNQSETSRGSRRGRSDTTTRTVASSSKSKDDSKSSTKTASTKPAKLTKSAEAIKKQYATYAAGRVKRYDANRDGVLSIEECKAGNAALAAADTDKNRKITVEEVAIFYQNRFQ